MKKIFGALFFTAILVFWGSPVGAQAVHYELIAEPGTESSLPSLAHELELRFNVYNRLFRFDLSSLPAPLNVRVFIDPAAYDSYISARLGTTRPGAVYLHYNQHDRRELVILRGSPEEAAMIGHQSFIQFLRAFIPNPPSWMREGFAIYFNSVKYDSEERILMYEENLSWLETVKGLGPRLMFPREILLADTVAIEDVPPAGNDRLSGNFQICAWALVSFLLNSDEDYFRTLTESFMLLSPEYTAFENSMAVMSRFSEWTDFYAMDSEYTAYLNSRRTFAELIEEGRQYYDLGDPIMAELMFLAAQYQRPEHYAPYYYLGLLYYEEKVFSLAEEYYLLSIEYGADEALVSYALGVNAASANRYDDAVFWLKKASALDPARYQTRAEEMIENLMIMPN